MGHQQHVSGTIVLIMQSKVIHLTKVRSGADDVCAVLEEVRAQCLDEACNIFGTVARSDG